MTGTELFEVLDIHFFTFGSVPRFVTAHPRWYGMLWAAREELRNAETLPSFLFGPELHVDEEMPADEIHFTDVPVAGNRQEGCRACSSMGKVIAKRAYDFCEGGSDAPVTWSSETCPECAGQGYICYSRGERVLAIQVGA